MRFPVSFMLAIILGIQTCLPVLSESPSELRSQEAVLDSGSPRSKVKESSQQSETPQENAQENTQENASSKSPMLTGAVQKHGRVGDADAGNSSAQTTSNQFPTLDTGAKQDQLNGTLGKKWFWFHIGKNKMTSEDYRKLEFGITGFVSVKQLFAKYPVITEIYPGCPAEKAGLRPGDVVLKANDHEFKRSDMQPEFWRILDGRAGTTVVVTVRRRKEILTFTLTRMNIEDIQDGRIRRTFERMLRTLGPPTGAE